MIRAATQGDVAGILATYESHFDFEDTHTRYTVFRRGVYPTVDDISDALDRNCMYVYEEQGVICGSIIIDDRQPEDYGSVEWAVQARFGEVLVIHLLVVDPRCTGRGIGSALIQWVEETARERKCICLRLDTGAQNIPATRLYQKLGFEIRGKGKHAVGGAISHDDHLFLEKLIM